MSNKKPLPNLFYDRPLDARLGKALHPHKGGERGVQDSFYEPYKYYDPFVEGERQP